MASPYDVTDAVKENGITGMKRLCLWSFRGRPCRRKHDPSPSRIAVASVQPSPPNGRPRDTECGNRGWSPTESGPLTRSSHPRGARTGVWSEDRRFRGAGARAGVSGERGQAFQGGRPITLTWSGLKHDPRIPTPVGVKGECMPSQPSQRVERAHIAGQKGQKGHTSPGQFSRRNEPRSSP